jgi:hypothetical protein
MKKILISLAIVILALFNTHMPNVVVSYNSR